MHLFGHASNLGLLTAKLWNLKIGAQNVHVTVVMNIPLRVVMSLVVLLCLLMDMNWYSNSSKEGDFRRHFTANFGSASLAEHI